MQLINTTIVTSVTEIKELIQHCIVHNFEGQINLTFEDGKIIVYLNKISAIIIFFVALMIGKEILSLKF